MLEDINNVLNGGDVPNLYKPEDYESIEKVGKVLCVEKNIQVSKTNMFTQYLGRLQQNIHMIIAMSPLGEIFRARIRQFPSLVTCCTIDWFTEWPEEALLGVGRGQMLASNIELNNDLEACVETFKYIHQSVEIKSVEFKDQLSRKNYVTPTSYLELLNNYQGILTNKRKEVQDARTRLVKGLDVLAQAGKEIAILKTEIDEMAPKLSQTKKELEITTQIIVKETADADIERDIVSKDEAEATQGEAEAAALKQEAENELSKAMPQLEEATRILNQLKKDEFYVLK